jgi:hypothetical protein
MDLAIMRKSCSRAHGGHSIESLFRRRMRSIFSMSLLSLVIIELSLSAPAYAGSSANIMGSSRFPTPVAFQEGKWITIGNLPLGTHFIGDSFTVYGETNFPSGTEIDYGAYSSLYAPGSPSLLPPHFAGSTWVVNGTGGNNTWSFVMDTTRFEKNLENGTVIHQDAVDGEHTLSLTVPGAEHLAYTVPFTLKENPAIINGTPAPENSGRPKDTTNPGRALPQTTQSATLVPVVASAAIGCGILLAGRRER